MVGLKGLDGSDGTGDEMGEGERYQPIRAVIHCDQVLSGALPVVTRGEEGVERMSRELQSAGEASGRGPAMWGCGTFTRETR